MSAAAERADRNVEGVVEMMLDATQNFDAAAHRTSGCSAGMRRCFPTGRSGMRKISGGRVARRRHRPDAGRLRARRARSACTSKRRARRGSSDEMRAFLDWFNAADGTDAVLKAGSRTSGS